MDTSENQNGPTEPKPIRDDNNTSQIEIKASEDDSKALELHENVKAMKEEENKAEYVGLPVDRGWAWVLLAGCVLYPLVYGGVNRSYGVYFLHYQERFNAKAAEVAVISLVENVTNSIVGLLIMTIGLKKISVRTSVAIGGGLIALSYILAVIATDIRVLYVLQGFVHGTGIAMVRSPTISIIGVYFNRHRGLAASIYTGSAAIGGFIFAPVVTNLFQSYGYTGTMIITGGLFMNILVAASVMRPPSWFSKGKEKRKQLLNTSSQSAMSDSKRKEQTGRGLEQLKQDISSKDNDENAKYTNRLQEHEYLENHDVSQKLLNENRNVKANGETNSTKGSKLELYGAYDSVHSSLVSINRISVQQTNNYNKPMKSSCFHILKNNVTVILKLFDFKMLKNLNFILYLTMAFMLVSGMVLIPYYLPQFAKDAGLSYDQIAIMISALAVTDFLSKIVSGIIADRGLLRRSTMLAFAAIGVGSICQFTRFFSSFVSVVAMAVIMACFCGWYTSMYSTILIDCVGLENLQSSLGFASVAHGISISVFFTLAGLLRDITGSYIYSLHMAGGLCYAGAIFLLLMSVVQRKQKVREMTVDIIEKHNQNI